jgi:hypothetical protein
VSFLICSLLGIMLACSDLPDAEHYREGLEMVPAAHRQMVRQLVMREKGAKAQHSGGVIYLPALGKQKHAIHEVGHAVGDAVRDKHGERAVDAWKRKWRKVGPFPVSTMASVKEKYREHFAEAYRMTIDGTLDRPKGGNRRMASEIRRIVPGMPPPPPQKR